MCQGLLKASFLTICMNMSMTIMKKHGFQVDSSCNLFDVRDSLLLLYVSVDSFLHPDVFLVTLM